MSPRPQCAGSCDCVCSASSWSDAWRTSECCGCSDVGTVQYRSVPDRRAPCRSANVPQTTLWNYDHSSQIRQSTTFCYTTSCAACDVRPTQYAPPPCRWWFAIPRYGWFLVTALSGLVTLTSDLLTLELVRNITRDTDNFPAKFGK